VTGSSSYSSYPSTELFDIAQPLIKPFSSENFLIGGRKMSQWILKYLIILSIL
jgi:hypothetical protein